MTKTSFLINKIARNRWLWIHVTAWALLLLLPYILGLPANHSGTGVFFILAGFLHIGLFYFNAFFLYPTLYTLRRWVLYIITGIAMIVLVILLKRYILHTWFPLAVADKNGWRMIVAPTVITFFASIVYRNISDKAQAEKERQQKKEEALSTELKFLRSQISPHFMFNILTNLVSLARKKSDQMENALLMLSGLMRYMLYDTHHHKIRLNQELEYLKSYIALQQLRFGDTVRTELDIALPDTAESVEIEPMLLIPFVENAFKHGVGFEDQSWIAIGLRVQEKILYFEVKNNFSEATGKSIDTENVSGIGIENVRARLEMLYKGNYTLEIVKTGELFGVNLQLVLV